MKLLRKTSRYYSMMSFGILITGGVLFFLTVKYFINTDVVEKLNMDKAFVEARVKIFDSIPDAAFAINGNLILQKVNPEGTFKPIIKDTLLYDEKEGHEEVAAKSITFLAYSKHNTYKITLIKSLLETDDLIEAISIALFVLIALFLMSLYFINIRISKRIWNPFYESLDKIKKYDLTNASKLQLNYSDIDEFNELDKAIESMTDKILSDYKNLKEFTEDASHEIQTPLAVIKSKLELLIQTENLKEEQMLLIQSINDAASKLSRLNQSLLLLAKIENHQYLQKESVNLNDVVRKHIENYRELIEAKGLFLKVNSTSNFVIKINPLLADVLITNLIGNAVKHNMPGGKIVIEMSATYFMISNTGKPLTQDPAQLFYRFKKDNTDSQSLGLGLAIVKKICDTEHIHVKYVFNQPVHQIILTF